MRNLIAIRPLVYATRRLLPGDDFMTRTDRDARILIATGRARRSGVPAAPSASAAPAPAAPAPAAPAPAAQEQPPTNDDGDLAALRAQYKEIVGKRPHHAWGAEELQRRIDEAQAS